MLEKTKIDEIIYELNEVFGEDNDEGHSFVYSTNGWYECIRFNEHVLWDTEDTQAWLHERPDWDEDGDVEDDYDEDVVGCIKRRYNDYINKLKGYRFNVETKRDKNNEAFDATEEIFDELNGRKGIHLDELDVDIQQEIFDAFTNIIEKYN